MSFSCSKALNRFFFLACSKNFKTLSLALKTYKAIAPTHLSSCIGLTVLLAMSPCHSASIPTLFMLFHMLGIPLTCLLCQASKSTSQPTPLWRHPNQPRAASSHFCECSEHFVCISFASHILSSSQQGNQLLYHPVSQVTPLHCSKLCRGSHLTQLNAEVPRNLYLGVSHSTPATHSTPVRNYFLKIHIQAWLQTKWIQSLGTLFSKPP